MKLSPIVCVAAAWTASFLHAQELPPELAEPAAKYKATVESLDKQRLATVAQASQSYVATLDEIKKAATTKGDVKTSEAATKERDAALAGKLPPDLPAGLPALRLQGTRKALLMKLEPVNADFGKRKKRLDGEYLGFLDSLKQKADPESALAKRIEAEKEEILALEKADNEKSDEDKNEAKPIHGKNIVVNGDFEKADASEKPEGWDRVHNVTLVSENNNSFIRFAETTNRDGVAQNLSLTQPLTIPKSARYATVSARLRTKGCVLPPNVKDLKKPGVTIEFKDQKGNSFSWIGQTWCGKNGSWRTLQAEGSIPEKPVSASVTFERGCFPGQVDFDDVEVSFK